MVLLLYRIPKKHTSSKHTITAIHSLLYAPTYHQLQPMPLIYHYSLAINLPPLSTVTITYGTSVTWHSLQWCFHVLILLWRHNWFVRIMLWCHFSIMTSDSIPIPSSSKADNVTTWFGGNLTFLIFRNVNHKRLI